MHDIIYRFGSDIVLYLSILYSMFNTIFNYMMNANVFKSESITEWNKIKMAVSQQILYSEEMIHSLYKNFVSKNSLKCIS